MVLSTHPLNIAEPRLVTVVLCRTQPSHSARPCLDELEWVRGLCNWYFGVKQKKTAEPLTFNGREGSAFAASSAQRLSLYAALPPESHSRRVTKSRERA
jgi:hypothetical protein